MEEARRHPGREQEVIDHFKSNPQAMEQLSAPVYEEKVVDFILEKATVTDKKTTLEDLIKSMETDDDKPKGKSKAKPKSKAKSKAKPKSKAKSAKKPAKKPKKKTAKKD
jgi:trigger factor